MALSRLGELRATTGKLLSRLIAAVVREAQPQRIAGITIRRPISPLPTVYSLGRVRRVQSLGSTDREIAAALQRRFGDDDDDFDDDDPPVNVAAEARRISRAISWELRIPGQHYSGVSNQKLLEFRQNEGRDFGKDTVALRNAIRDGITARFTASTWDEDVATDTARRVILDWIIKRVEDGGNDVRLKPLSPRYRRWKSQHGLDLRIGIAKGVWLRALRRAIVEVEL